MAPGVEPETVWEFLQRKVQNKLNRLAKVQGVKAAGKAVGEKSDAYVLARLMPGKVETQVNKGEEQFVDPLIKHMVATKSTMDDLDLYLTAQHAPERNAAVAKINAAFATPEQPVGAKAATALGEDVDPEILAARKGLPGSGMFATAAEKAQAMELNKGNAEMFVTVSDMPVAEEVMAQFQQQGKTAALEKAAKYVQGLNAKTRQILYDAGLIDAPTKAAWEKYKWYVPLRGISGEKPAVGRTGAAFQVRGPESQRALGRKSLAENVVGTSVMQFNEAVIRAEKNRVDQAFLKFAKDHPDESLWEVVEKPPTKRFYDKRAGQVTEREDSDWLRRPENANVLSLKVDGKPVYVRINDEPLARAMTGMGTEQTGAIVRGMATVNRYLSVVNTTLVPEFVLSNFARDLQTAMVNVQGLKGLTKEQSSGLARDILKGTAKAAVGVWKGEHGGTGEFAKYYQEYKANGGQIGFFSMKDAEQAQNRLNRAIQSFDPKVASTTLRYAKAAGDFIMDCNQSVENATRLSTYTALRKRGVSAQQAAMVARDITVDFNLKGEWGGVVNALWLFSNASIQGTARLAKALKDSPKVRAIAAGIIATSFANAEFNRLAGGQDPDDKENRYDKVPNSEKQRNMIFMGVGDEGQHVTIPIPYGYNVFWAIGQAASTAIHSENGATKGTALVADAIANSFNPLGGTTGTIWQTVMPTIGRLPLDLALNKDWRGQPIMPESRYGPEKAAAFRSFKSTPALAKGATEAASRLTGGREYKPGLVDVSPDQLEYVIEYATGGAGGTLMRGLNLATKVFKGKKLKAREIPFARRVYAELHESVDTQEFYKTLDELQKSKAQFKTELEKAPELGKQYAAEHRGELRPVVAKKGQSQLTTAMVQEIQLWREKAKRLDEEGKRDEAENARKIINQKAKRYTLQLKTMMKAKD